MGWFLMLRSSRLPWSVNIASVFLKLQGQRQGSWRAGGHDGDRTTNQWIMGCGYGAPAGQPCGLTTGAWISLRRRLRLTHIPTAPTAAMSFYEKKIFTLGIRI